MARFSNRTVNETYREQRELGDDDATARTRVSERLQAVFGEVPTEAEMNDAAAHYEAHPPEPPAAPRRMAPASFLRAKPLFTAADFAGRDDIEGPLDVPCPMCGSEPHQSCVEHGATFPTHRARVVLVQDIQDARAHRRHKGEIT